jgi:4-hydroxybenzoate polyprenyltransferase
MADKDIDSYVRRTYTRPLASGAISQQEALLVACVMLLTAFLLVLTTNRLTVMLSLVAVPLAITYPFMKRYTYIPQFFLGLAFSWGIPMAFTAVTGSVSRITGLLFIANILWAVIYDTIYAMVDRDDDVKIGVKSTAILFDDADTTIIGILQAMFLIVLVTIGIQIHAEMIYYYSLVAGAGFMLYHQYLIKDRDPERCFQAFLNNNWLGMAIFFGVYLNYI